MFSRQCCLWAPSMSAEAGTRCRLTHWGGCCSAGISHRAGGFANSPLVLLDTRCQMWHSCSRRPRPHGSPDVPLWGVTVPIWGCCKSLLELFSKAEDRADSAAHGISSDPQMGDEFFLSQRTVVFRSVNLGFFAC